MKKEKVAKVETLAWHATSLNTALIEDYVTHCSDHFTPGARALALSRLDPLAADTLQNVLWVVSGVVELTSTRYHHRTFSPAPDT